MFRHATTLLFASALTLGAAACDIDQTDDGELPEVEVQGGDLPEYDVDPVDVDVETQSETVEVPDIDIDTNREQVEVPDIDIQSQDDQQE